MMIESPAERGRKGARLGDHETGLARAPFWRPVARPLVVAVTAALALASIRADRGILDASTPEDAVAAALTERGLVCDPADVVWVEMPRGLTHALRGGARAIAVAHSPNDPTDLFSVNARVSPEGRVLEVGSLHNLTETSGVDESRPIVRGRFAVYTTSADGLVTAVHVLDLGGRAAESYSDLRFEQRLQVALTNLQQTGRTAGVLHTTYALEPLARRSKLIWRSDGIVALQADEHEVAIDPYSGQVVTGGDFVRVVADERARPGNLVTWAADRMRAMTWFGDERMQWVKAIAFTLLDKVHVAFSPTSTAEDVRDELGIGGSATPLPSAAADPETGWPPPPIRAIASPPLAGEGRWITLDRDPFITPTESGNAPAFATTFIRPSAERPDVRIYVTLWDPRQIALHVEAGTVEPTSATGEHGAGLVPRAPEVMKRFVAGFNGGFQAQHGEYGMQANGIEYLPPKPYAATVLEMRDGSSAFGAWPGSAPVPDDVIGMRQNLTALVQNDAFNPWGRTWWGGAPPGWPDQIHTTRSAICLTKEGFVGYFYSMSISAEDLGRGMLATRCSFGIHLDMNPGHSGFEFYNVAGEGTLAPLGRRLQPTWEAEGKVPGMPGYVFRSRRMIRGMGHMLFPRYIQREARDFFYLTSRSILPGSPLGTRLPSPEPGEGVWQTRDLPQHGFPPAIALTSIRMDPSHPSLRFRVLRVDPRTVAPIDRAAPDAPAVLAWAAPGHGELSLWWSPRAFAIGSDAPGPDAVALAGGRPFDLHASGARAAAGVQDDDGMLVWVELPHEANPDASTGDAMEEVLKELGCSQQVFLDGEAQAFLGGATGGDAAGHASTRPLPIVARLVRTEAPGAHAAFVDTPIVPIQVWQPLQAKRVRYFLKPSVTQSANAGLPTATQSSPGRRLAEPLAREPTKR
jgi:hypothetical protein